MHIDPTEPRKARNLPTGIEEWHRQHCRSREGGRCNCTPAYRAWVFDRRTRKKVRSTMWRNSREAHRGSRRGGVSDRTRGRSSRRAAD
jgi:hypothetical protein